MKDDFNDNNILAIEASSREGHTPKWYVGQQDTYAKTISESDVNLFADITGDFNPVHINSIAAKQSPFGERLVHGILVTGLISAAIGMKLPGEGSIYMEQDVKFIQPVKIGDTITVTVTIEEILNRQKGILRLSTQAYNQMNEKVIDGYAIVKAPSGE